MDPITYVTYSVHNFAATMLVAVVVGIVSGLMLGGGTQLIEIGTQSQSRFEIRPYVGIILWVAGMGAWLLFGSDLYYHHDIANVVVTATFFLVSLLTAGKLCGGKP